MKRRIITIDGPAGAGKGTVASIVAKHLQFIQLDSGALYRLLTFHFLEKYQAIPTDQDMIVEELRTIQVSLEIVDDKITWYLKGKKVGREIYDSTLSLFTAELSKLIPIREKVNILLRELSQNHDIIIDGRDMGSVVFPHADIKFYLDASPEIRARRRHQQLLAKGEHISYEEVLAQTLQRDEIDRTKKFGALRIPEGAHVVDSSHMTIQETAEAMILHVNSHLY